MNEDSTLLYYAEYNVNARNRILWARDRIYGVREGALRKNIWNVYICGKGPLLEHGVYEKVPCAHACARLSRLSFRALLTSG